MKTIRFYRTTGDRHFGDATMDDDGNIEYSNDSVRNEMDTSVRNMGPEWAWARFSAYGTQSSYSKLVTD